MHVAQPTLWLIHCLPPGDTRKAGEMIRGRLRAPSVCLHPRGSTGTSGPSQPALRGRDSPAECGDLGGSPRALRAAKVYLPHLQTAGRGCVTRWRGGLHGARPHSRGRGRGEVWLPRARCAVRAESLFFFLKVLYIYLRHRERLNSREQKQGEGRRE